MYAYYEVLSLLSKKYYDEAMGSWDFQSVKPADNFELAQSITGVIPPTERNQWAQLLDTLRICDERTDIQWTALLRELEVICENNMEAHTTETAGLISLYIGEMLDYIKH